jgi:hypothetical protein
MCVYMCVYVCVCVCVWYVCVVCVCDLGTSAMQQPKQDLGF